MDDYFSNILFFFATEQAKKERLTSDFDQGKPKRLISRVVKVPFLKRVI